MSVPSSPSSTPTYWELNPNPSVVSSSHPKSHTLADMGTGVLRGILRIAGHSQSPPAGSEDNV